MTDDLSKNSIDILIEAYEMAGLVVDPERVQEVRDYAEEIVEIDENACIVSN